MADAFSDLVLHFKTEWGDRCIVDEDRKTIMMLMFMEHQTFRIVCVLKLPIYEILIGSNLKIPQDKMAQACILANMINAEIPTTFVIDPVNRELDVTLSFCVTGSSVTFDTVKANLFTSVFCADKYYPAFEKLVSTDITPEEAIKSAEGGTKD